MHLDNEPDADQLRLMIKALATRPDAGPVLGAILGNAVTVPKNATRDTLIREIRKWYTGQLTN